MIFITIINLFIHIIRRGWVDILYHHYLDFYLNNKLYFLILWDLILGQFFFIFIIIYLFLNKIHKHSFLLLLFISFIIIIIINGTISTIY